MDMLFRFYNILLRIWSSENVNIHISVFKIYFYFKVYKAVFLSPLLQHMGDSNRIKYKGTRIWWIIYIWVDFVIVETVNISPHFYFSASQIKHVISKHFPFQIVKFGSIVTKLTYYMNTKSSSINTNSCMNTVIT